MQQYRGRFAPSPTGPLHMGSLVAAMASYLDARAHEGIWIVRIEDLDFDRNVEGAGQSILNSLARCGMCSDEEVVWQSRRINLYESAMQKLSEHVFPCACSRKEIADSRVRAGLGESQIYPGTCRLGIAEDKVPRSYRLRVPEDTAARIQFNDRLLQSQHQNLVTDVGDFVLKRSDGFWAYQLAVVVDDAAQNISDIVRGADLLDSTARQIYLQELLKLPTPRYLHVPVLTNQQGEKLSKQTGALAFDRGDNDLLHEALLPAAQFLQLGLTSNFSNIDEFWVAAVPAWANRYLR